MRTLTPVVFVLFAASLLPGLARAGDAEGCVDLKLLPRLEGCVIQECSAKQHDSFEAGDGSGAPADANLNVLAYSCPVGDLAKMKRDFVAELRKAGFQSISEDKSDGAGPGLTARRNSQWLHWSANSEDGASAYVLTLASAATEKFRAEACGKLPVYSSLKQCEVVECTSKSEDSVAMRTALKAETSLTGNVEALTLACPSISPLQAFSAVEGELQAAGYDILFSDRERPENSWITGRSGQRWVELVSAPESGESVSYALTVVPSAEVLTATAEPSLVTVATPEPPAPAASPDQARTVQPAAVAAPLVIPAADTPMHTGFVPASPVLQVPIEARHDRIYRVTGEVVINMLVDVNASGAVTKAELTGRITKDVLTLEQAALDAVWRWRFEPARQDGHAVPAAKIPVQLRFRGRPWRF